MELNGDKRQVRLVSRGALLVLGASLVCIAVGQAIELSTGLLVLVFSAGLASIGAFVGLESAARVRERDGKAFSGQHSAVSDTAAPSEAEC